MSFWARTRPTCEKSIHSGRTTKVSNANLMANRILSESDGGLAGPSNIETTRHGRAGDDKARKKKRGFLMGELMKATKGSANPQVLNQLLDEALA